MVRRSKWRKGGTGQQGVVVRHEKMVDEEFVIILMGLVTTWVVTTWVKPKSDRRCVRAAW